MSKDKVEAIAASKDATAAPAITEAPKVVAPEVAEQQQLLDAIVEDAICFSVTAAMPVGAALLALNQIARSYGQREKSAQEWGEELLADGMLARKRSWKYTAQTRDNKEFRKEMEDITKLFSIPPAEHPEYMKRVMARFEAEQACKARFGIQG